MIAVTLKQTEAEPESWPAVTGLSAAAGALEAGPIWQRLEAWTGLRFAERVAVWEVQGPGVWALPIDGTLTGAERYQGGWQAVDLVPHPDRPAWRLGEGLYRITATVGDAPPAVAVEAFRRLAEYLSDKITPASVTAQTETIGGPGGNATTQVQRAFGWMPRAIHLSGAADVLRPIRRAR